MTITVINDNIRSEVYTNIYMEYGKDAFTSSVDVYKTLSGPLDAQIELTSRCNNYCLHCYNYWRGTEFQHRNTNFTDSSLSCNGLGTIINTLADHQILSLTFTGGEPLIRSDELFKGIELAKQRDIICSINSNLSLITPEPARKLKVLGTDAILASLHSNNSAVHDLITQRTGSFRQTIKGIDVCLEEGLKITVNMVVSAFNKDQVLDTGKFVKSIGVNSFAATKVSPCMGGLNFDKIGINREEYKKMLNDLLLLEQEEGMSIDSLISYPLCALGNWDHYKKFTERKCAGGVATCTISAEGNIRPCTVSDEVYGNIFSESFENIWRKMGDWRDGSRIPKKCLFECEYFSDCRAGCRMNAKYCNGIDGMDPLATVPGDVSNLPQIESEMISLVDFMNRKFVLGEKIKFRSEDFGGILSNGPRASIFLNKLSYTALVDLKFLGRPFTVQEVQSQFHLSESPNQFFFRLLRLGIIQLIDETSNA